MIIYEKNSFFIGMHWVSCKDIYVVCLSTGSTCTPFKTDRRIQLTSQSIIKTCFILHLTRISYLCM
jgi:hypothetical protein